MFTPEQLSIPVEGLSVQDAIVAVQTIDRLAQAGVSGQELAPLAVVRSRLIAAVEGKTGVNYDTARKAQTPAD